MGFLYAHTNKKERAYNYLKRVTELHSHDVEAWIQLAQLAQDNYSESLKDYEQAKKILESKKEAIPPELWNNIGVLSHLQEMHKEAEEAYTKAITLSGHSMEEFATQNITTIYNIARLREDTCRFGEAEELYKKILRKHPTYTDCKFNCY